MSAFAIDAFEFCRLKERRNGQIAIADMPRLAEECADSAGVLQWSVEGGKDSLGHPRIKLLVTGSVKLICQRCLQAFDFAIGSDSVLILATNEAAADEIEEQLDDDTVEVIVGSKALDLIALVEDEALLALSHSIKLPEKESPFSVLKNLKKS
jgi:uncharacterized protein